jgi:hypothetical protein
VGSDGGGNGTYRIGSSTTNGSAGTANTGGGGGGGHNGIGYNAGSGVVQISYAGPQVATGGTVTSNGSTTFHTFNSSGSFVTSS